MATRDIIVIGGSSGATAPLKSTLARLRADFPAAIFVVLHIPSRSQGLVATVASAQSPLPTRQAEDGLPFQSGHVYVAAPDRHLIITRDHIRLGAGPRENLTRPAIDPLFRSAAIAYGPRVIGVLLSGLLSDGAAGLAAIKQCGGIVVVQDPEDAAADEMPRRALDAVAADRVVPGDALGDVLAELVGQPPGPAVPIPPEIALEVDIAMGKYAGPQILAQFAEPSALSCPSCGGVLSTVRGSPLRFRCQVGHAYTADALASRQEDRVDEALRIALRIIEERAELVSRMAEEGRQSGRKAVAEMYEYRAREYREYADTLRAAVIRSLAPTYAPDTDGE